jgi:hypothetical protein
MTVNCPVEDELGGFGAEALVAPLADGQAELGGAGVLVDPLSGLAA